MAIKVTVPSNLFDLTRNQEVVEVQGKTVQECIDDLIRRYPDFKDWLNPNNPLLWVALNQTLVPINETDTEVKDGDEIGLVMVIGGG